MGALSNVRAGTHATHSSTACCDQLHMYKAGPACTVHFTRPCCKPPYCAAQSGMHLRWQSMHATIYGLEAAPQGMRELTMHPCNTPVRWQGMHAGAGRHKSWEAHRKLKEVSSCATILDSPKKKKKKKMHINLFQLRCISQDSKAVCVWMQGASICPLLSRSYFQRAKQRLP